MIEGVRQIPVKTFVDDRGYLTQIIQETDGIMPPTKRIYVTGNFARGVIRGYHKHSREWKGFFVASGAAKFVLVDDRKDSPTYKNIDTFVLSPASPTVLVIPTGIYNGWMSLDDNTILLGISTDPFNKEDPDDERLPPDSYGDVWTVKGR